MSPSVNSYIGNRTNHFILSSGICTAPISGDINSGSNVSKGPSKVTKYTVLGPTSALIFVPTSVITAMASRVDKPDRTAAKLSRLDNASSARPGGNKRYYAVMQGYVTLVFQLFKIFWKLNS